MRVKYALAASFGVCLLLLSAAAMVANAENASEGWDFDITSSKIDIVNAPDPHVSVVVNVANRSTNDQYGGRATCHVVWEIVCKKEQTRETKARETLRENGKVVLADIRNGGSDEARVWSDDNTGPADSCRANIEVRSPTGHVFDSKRLEIDGPGSSR